MQEDPIGPVAELNAYAYVGNNPTKWIDPSGLLRREGKIKIPMAGEVDFGQVWPQVKQGMADQLTQKLPSDFPPIDGLTQEETIDQLAEKFADELGVLEGVELRKLKEKSDRCSASDTQRLSRIKQKAGGIVNNVFRRIRREQKSWPWNSWDPYFDQLRSE